MVVGILLRHFSAPQSFMPSSSHGVVAVPNANNRLEESIDLASIQHGSVTEIVLTACLIAYY